MYTFPKLGLIVNIVNVVYGFCCENSADESADSALGLLSILDQGSAMDLAEDAL